MGITIKVLLAVVVASSITTAAPPRQNFLLEIYPNGTFEIGFRINWITPGFWFRSGPIFVTDGDERYSTEDGSLLLKTFQEYNSNLDPFGQYTAWEYTWVNKQNSILLHTEVMKFYGENPIVLFRSYAGKDWINTAGQPTGISCSFPSLIPLDSSAYSGDRGWMTYSGNSKLRHFIINHQLVWLCKTILGGGPKWDMQVFKSRICRHCYMYTVPIAVYGAMFVNEVRAFK